MWKALHSVQIPQPWGHRLGAAAVACSSACSSHIRGRHRQCSLVCMSALHDCSLRLQLLIVVCLYGTCVYSLVFVLLNHHIITAFWLKPHTKHCSLLKIFQSSIWQHHASHASALAFMSCLHSTTACFTCSSFLHSCFSSSSFILAQAFSFALSFSRTCTDLAKFWFLPAHCSQC